MSFAFFDLPPTAQAAVRCALADLIGAYQAWELDGCNDSLHDWEAHLTTIDELALEFDLQDEIPEDMR